MAGIPRRLGRTLLFAGIGALLILGVFREPVFSGGFLWGPDSASMNFVALRRSLPGWFFGQWFCETGLGYGAAPLALNPFQLVLLLAPAAAGDLWTYVAAAAASVLAGYYFLAGRGAAGWPGLLGGLALAFTAHTFTIIAAGHVGKLETWPLGILMMAGVDRGVRERSLFHLALAGLCAGFGFTLQADLVFLFALAAAAFGVFLFIRHRPGAQGDAKAGARQWAAYAGRLLAGGVLAGAMFAMATSGFMEEFLKGRLAERQKFAEEGLGTAAGVSGEADKARRKWEFATNWSLPPADALEFVAPCVYGIQTGDARGPYWGALGRTLGWDKHRQGLRNLRQHTVYLGVLQIVFAAFAVAAAVRRRVPPTPAKAVVPKGKAAVPGSAPRIPVTASADGFWDVTAPPDGRCQETLFWVGVLAAALLLAFGRNLPFYRLFYALPFASNMRAPVKLLHLVEFSLCTLFAFGVQAFLSDLRRGSAEGPSAAGASVHGRPGRSHLAATLGCVAAAMALFVAAGLAESMKGGLFSLWRNWGFEQEAPQLLALMKGGLVHGGLLFAAAAALFLAARYLLGRRHIGAGLLCALTLLLCLDLGSVAKKYVVVWDEYERFAPGDVLRVLRQNEGHFRVSLPVEQGIYVPWATYTFRKHGIEILDEARVSTRSREEGDFLKAVARDPVRMWQITSVRDVLGPVAALRGFVGKGSCQAAAWYDVLGDGSVAPAPPEKAQHVWLRIQSALPRALVCHAWEPVPVTGALARIADPAWDPTASVLVEGVRDSGPGGPPTGARIEEYTANRVRVGFETPSPGIL
jgi:hypothetical protein